MHAGIIDLGSVQEQVAMKKREKILNRHPYAWWEGKDGKWRTYIPDESKKNNRRLVKRNTEREITDYIVDFYEEDEKETKGVSLVELYPEWLKFKSLHTNATSYINRIVADWKRYYISEKIIHTPIKELTCIQLDEWIHKTIKANNLTKKQYYNMTVIFRQVLDYAVGRGLIETNPFSKVVVNKKLFRKVPKKISKTQVFLVGEEENVIKEALNDFYENGKDTAALAIPFNFQVGLRSGELVALKESDIEGDTLHVQRMEVKVYEISEDGTTGRCIGREVVEYAKSDAGIRDVYLTQEAKEIIEIILQTNRERQASSDYLFLDKAGTRISTYVVDNRITKYCRHIGIPEKRIHKIRKTYISTLIDSQLNIDEVRRQAGHEDEKTTYANYCFNRLEENPTHQKIEQALCKNRSYKRCNMKVVS